MAVVKILKFPNPRLREVAKPFVLPETDEEIKAFDKMLADLNDTLMSQTTGVALAANQIGYDVRVVCVKVNAFSTRLPNFVFNPSIIELKGDTVILDEGCLSFPGFRKKKERKPWVKIQFSTFGQKKDEIWDLIPKEEIFEGFDAQILQHEIDHLNGVLFIDDTSRSQRQRLAAQFSSQKGG